MPFHRGFSLIELLVVITIMSMMMGAGIFAYSKIQSDKSLSSGVKLINTTMYQARQEALLGKARENCRGAFEGNQVELINFGTGLRVTSICDIQDSDPDDIALPGGVEVTPDDAEVMFTSVKMGTDLIINELPLIVRYGDDSATITIYKSGDIK